MLKVTPSWIERWLRRRLLRLCCLVSLLSVIVRGPWRPAAVQSLATKLPSGLNLRWSVDHTTRNLLLLLLLL